MAGRLLEDLQVVVIVLCVFENIFNVVRCMVSWASMDAPQIECNRNLMNRMLASELAWVLLESNALQEKPNWSIWAGWMLL